MEVRLHDYYLTKEIRGPFLISLAACLMMMIVQELYTVMDLLTAHRFPLGTLGLYLLYKLPLMVQKSLPVAVPLPSAHLPDGCCRPASRYVFPLREPPVLLSLLLLAGSEPDHTPGSDRIRAARGIRKLEP
ncbi:MAG: LptF/LptG family permease [Chloroflexi bacterium]|nr:LptF/LptG family permease [Chloroflexota bacterium]